MQAIDLGSVVERLRSANSFLIATHAGPDGDALGSMFGLYHLLRGMGKEQIVCACQDPVPKRYAWLPGVDRVVDESAITGPYDLVVITDVAQLERTGSIADCIGADQDVLVLDHHLDEAPGGTWHYVDPTYSSASEIIVALFEESGVELTLEAAECAYVGLATDTGGFRFSNTNPRAHTNAITLIEAGIDVGAISARVFDVISVPKSKLLCVVLDRLEISACGRFAHSTLTPEDMVSAGATGEDVDGLVNFTRNIEGVQVGVLFRGLQEDTVKVSMRSLGGFNSASLLKRFGGGGHAGAAGAELKMNLESAQRAIVNSVRERLASQ